MKGFSFFPPFCTKFLQCGWKVSPVCEFPEKSGLWTLRPSSLGGAGQVADPQKKPSKLVREGESQAHLHLGPASPTCALGQGVCQLDHSVMAWRTRYRQSLWPGLLAPFIKAARQLQNRGLHQGARPGTGFSKTTAAPSLHTYCVPGSLKLVNMISHLLLTEATRNGGLYYS